MRKLILAILLMTGFGNLVQAQQSDSSAPYRKRPVLPAFQILQSDSTWFTDTKIPPNRPVVIMYFSPECGHCQLEAEDLVKHMDSLKKAFFVMVSYHSPQDIAGFAHKYKLDSLDNVRLGRDTEYYLPSFYQVTQTPFIAVYDASHKLVEIFRTGAGAEKLAAIINHQQQTGKGKTKRRH